MVELLAHLIINAVLLLIVARIVPGLHVKGLGSAIIGAMVLGLVNFLVWPVMVILTLPLTVLTMGLFLLVINGFMLCLVSMFVPGIRLRGFGSAIVASLLFSLLNFAVAAMIGPQGQTVRMNIGWI
jgi:putative membrane protein